MKRVLCLILTLVMIVSMFTFGTFAEETDPVNYSITLVSNVESYDADAVNETLVISDLEAGTAIKLPQVDFALEGYELVGWHIMPVNFENKFWFEPRASYTWELCEYFDAENAMLTLYGVWAKTDDPVDPPVEPPVDPPVEPDDPDPVETITITIDYNRGRKDDIKKAEIEPGTAINLEKPTRKGYVFCGWYIGNKEYKGTPLTKKCTIKAIWRDEDECCGGLWGHKHKIVFTDGVKGKVIFKDVVKYVKHLSKTPTIKNPTREGYRFVGWTPKVSTYAKECVTYTAQWVPAIAPALNLKDHLPYLKGYGKGEIRPEGNITRAEVATILYRLLDDESLEYFYTTKNNFSDVNKGDWFNEAVSTLANADVINGYGAGKFNPHAPITRAELVVILARLSGEDYTTKCRFVDVASNHWAYDEIAMAQAEGWVKGYGAGYFFPSDYITRAEVAAILNRMLDRTDCVLKDTKNYVDNPVNAWYYEDMLEASIAH